MPARPRGPARPNTQSKFAFPLGPVRAWFAFACVLCALCIPEPSRAAPPGVRADFEPPDTAGWLRAGFFVFKPAFALKDVGIDNNVLLSRDNPKSDFTATASPAIAGAVRFGNRGFVTLKLGADHVWFSKFSIIDHTNYATSLKGNVNLRKLRLFASGEYLKVKERPNNELDQRTKRTNSIGKFGVGYEHSPRTAIDYILTSERIAYSDPDFRYRVTCKDSDLDGTLDPGCPVVACPDSDHDGTSDPGCPDIPSAGLVTAYTLDDLLSRTETTQTLRFTQRVMGRTRLIFDAQQRRYDFNSDLPPLDRAGGRPPVGSARDARETRFLAGFETSSGAFLSGSVKGGIVDLEPRVLTAQKTRLAVFKVNLNWRIGSRVLLSTGGDRDVYFSTFADNLYFREDHGALQCVYYLNRLLGIEAGYDGYRLRYPTVSRVDDARGEGRPPVFEGHRQDRIGIVRGGLRFRLANRTTATLKVASRHRTSNIPDSADAQVLVTTGVETTF